MRLDDERESMNVEDRRGFGGGMGIGGGLGIGGVLLALVAWYFGIDPSFILHGGAPSVSEQRAAPRAPGAPEDQQVRFVRQVLADTEDTWGELFSRAGKHYVDPKLVLYSGAYPSACGMGQAAMGPFYCPSDQKVYLDLSFFRDLTQRFRAPGDFAEAYVIAHEVGHHVQNLLGISGRVRVAQESNPARANALSVRLELQADCFAGVWAYHANRTRKILEHGDVEEALRAATAVGDDRLQRPGRGYVTPETFTHGTSEQRVRWFERGIDSGDVKQCDTFRAREL